MEHKITTETLQKVANYLVSKPYNEVAILLEDIKKCPPIEEPKDTKDVRSEDSSKQ